MAGNTGEPGASVAARVLGVLGSFDADHRHLTLTEIARRAGLPVPTAHRLVGEIVRWGGLARREDGSYEVARRLWDIGILASVQRDLREVAHPFLQDVHRTTGETVHLAVRDGRHALYVERLVARTSTAVISGTGVRLPLSATAVGKVLLAWAPADVVSQTVAALEPVTAWTITDPVVLGRQVEAARLRGFAVTAQEMTVGAWSVAVPIRTGPDQVVAALGLVLGPPRRDLTRFVPVLQVAARGIGRALPADWQAG